MKKKIKFENLTKSDQIKIKILRILSDHQEHTPSEMASILRTNGTTILTNCFFLKFIGLVEIEIKRTKMKIYYIRLKKNYDEIKLKDILSKLRNL